MPSLRNKISSLYKKSQYDRFDRGSSSGQHILQDALSDTALSDDEFPTSPTPIDEYDGKEPLRGIISDFGDVKSSPSTHRVTHSSYSSDMDIAGAKTIDESGVNIASSTFNDESRLISSPGGTQFITKPSLKSSKTFHYSKQFTSSYNVKGEGRSDIRKSEDDPPSRRSFDGTFFRSHGSRVDLTQSTSLTSISAIAPGYTITKKASFKLFPTINLGEDENMESNVFFDLEKPKKSDGKEKKKLKKRLLAFLYRASIFSLVFFLLSIFVFFTVSTVNSSDDSGYYTNGSPTTLVWISGLDLLLVLVIIFELFASVLMLRVYTLVKKIERPRELVNIDSYFGIFVYRVVVFLFYGILFLINFVCYALFVESRDHLAGWISCYGLVPLIAFITIAYNQYNAFKNDVPLDFDGEVTFHVSARNLACLSIGFLIKLISLIAFCSIGTMVVLFTIQAIALVDDIEKQPGVKYPITIDHHTYNIHMYCEGNPKSPYVALVDADIGIPSPYEYMHKLIKSLAHKGGIRACIIERGGYGFSDTGPLPRDGNHTLSEIVNTVYESRMRTPFLYIAHSSASFTARALAYEYPELISGMILLHPSHEDQETVLLKQVKNLTNHDIQLRKDTRDYIDDVIRYVNPIALPRLFKYFHFEFLLEYEDPYELYYMNGWKTYFDEMLNLTQSSINRKVIFQNKYTGCVWSELKHFQTDTAESIKYMRTLQTNKTTNNDSYKIIPTIILTAQNLLDGNCESNHFREGTNMCNNFNIWKEGRANAIRTLHSDLATLYNAKWEMIQSSYDLPIDVPDTITRYATLLFNKNSELNVNGEIETFK